MEKVVGQAGAMVVVVDRKRSVDMTYLRRRPLRGVGASRWPYVPRLLREMRVVSQVAASRNVVVVGQYKGMPWPVTIVHARDEHSLASDLQRTSIRHDASF